MSRCETAILNPGLRELLDRRNVDDQKKLLALIPDGRLNALRKAEIIEALARCLLGAGLVDLWNRLQPLEQSAVAEAVHEEGGIFDQGAFLAKYRSLPMLETEGRHQYDKFPTLLRLFIYPAENGVWGLPVDLHGNARKSSANANPKSPDHQKSVLAK